MLSGMHPCVIEAATEVPFGTITEDHVAELLEGRSVKVSVGMSALISCMSYVTRCHGKVTNVRSNGRRCYLGYTQVSEAAERAARFAPVFEANAMIFPLFGAAAWVVDHVHFSHYLMYKAAILQSVMSLACDSGL